MQFVSSRCFGWYLPSTLLAPMIDMINHYPDDQCTTEVIHLDWEMEKSLKKRREVKYRRLRKRFDLKEVLPKAKFGEKFKKSELIFFHDKYDDLNSYGDFRLLSDEQELLMALGTAERLLVEYKSVQIWHIPPLLPNESEDNDSDSEEENNNSEEEEDFEDVIAKLEVRILGEK